MFKHSSGPKVSDPFDQYADYRRWHAAKVKNSGSNDPSVDDLVQDPEEFRKIFEMIEKVTHASRPRAAHLDENEEILDAPCTAKAGVVEASICYGSKILKKVHVSYEDMLEAERQEASPTIGRLTASGDLQGRSLDGVPADTPIPGPICFDNSMVGFLDAYKLYEDLVQEAD